jgi:hypothetical protein
MNLTVEIPDEIADTLGGGQALSRRVPEGFALEEYKVGARVDGTDATSAGLRDALRTRRLP